MPATLYDIKTHEITCQHIREYPGATRDGVDVSLRLAVKQYIPKERPGYEGVTVIAAGGNGFPKEMYEPLWEDLLHTGLSIRSIWIADMAHQGKSGEVNNGNLGSDRELEDKLADGVDSMAASWIDHSRDLLALINHFRREMKPPLVGIGHSIGANSLINLSIMHPRLLSDLILFEPILGYIDPNGAKIDCTAEGVHFAYIASKRQSRWPSRREAESNMRKSRPYSTFDDRVLSRWFAYGLRFDGSNSDGPVELVTSRHHEATAYVRPLFNPLEERSKHPTRVTHPDLDKTVSNLGSFYCPESWHTFVRLSRLRARTLFVSGGNSVMFSEQKRHSIMEVTGRGLGGSGGKAAGAVREVVLPDEGHLLPFESVAKCAGVVASQLSCCEYRRQSAPVSSVDTSTGNLTPRWRGEMEKEWARSKQAKI